MEIIEQHCSQPSRYPRNAWPLDAARFLVRVNDHADNAAPIRDGWQEVINDVPWQQYSKRRPLELTHVSICSANNGCRETQVSFLSYYPHKKRGMGVVLYSDGSKLESGATGAGYVAYQGAIEVTRRAIPLGTGAEVFDAEAIAALAGVEAVMAPPNGHVCHQPMGLPRQSRSRDAAGIGLSRHVTRNFRLLQQSGGRVEK